MSIRHYAFANIGRDKGPKSSNNIDTASIIAVRDSVPDEQTAIFWAEIREGDDNNELGLIHKYFPGWKIYGAATREPIILSPDQPAAESQIFWIKNSAVRHWSPRRSVLVVNLQDEPESLVGCHPAAGANGQGDRPKWAIPLLQVSWDNTIEQMNRVKKRLHSHGRNVTTLIDANAGITKVYPLLPGEQVVWHDATDWGRVWPAAEWMTHFSYGGKVDLHIDSHDGHLMNGSYRRR